jgi:glycine/D-amino acid oxidase-like deaminating enzyme
MSDATSDVVVVGGGIAGCACAHALAERGLEVLVLERAGLAAGASGHNRGLLPPHPDPAATPFDPARFATSAPPRAGAVSG